MGRIAGKPETVISSQAAEVNKKYAEGSTTRW